MREWWEEFPERKSRKDFKRIFEESLRFVHPSEYLGSDYVDAYRVRTAIIKNTKGLLKSPHREFHKPTELDVSKPMLASKKQAIFNSELNSDPKSKTPELAKRIPTVAMYIHGHFAGASTGSYASVLKFGQYRKNIHCRCKKTTKERLDLLPAIVGLKTLKKACHVQIHTDSVYVVNYFNQPRIKTWLESGLSDPKTQDKNFDLWQKILTLAKTHRIEFVLDVEKTNPENRNCINLAVRAMSIPSVQPPVNND